jgi:hypothetical protein
LNINHFITSRYFVSFLPLFFIALYSSLNVIEIKFEKLKRILRIKLLFVILFVASNLIILPLYYRSEKQDFRSLVTYLKRNMNEGDKIFVVTPVFIYGMLHYFQIYPESRNYLISFSKGSEGEIELKKTFAYRNKTFNIYHSKTCCTQYVADGSRLWIVVGKGNVQQVRKFPPCTLKGYFDGSFLNLHRFPTDASMYLFLWDPKSSGEKGIDMPNE